MNRLPDTVADVIVVLGAAVWSGGRASPTLQRRAIHGAKLLRADCAKIAILSGGLGRHPPSEAQVMFDICRAYGIAADRLLLDNRSTTTLENVAFSAALMRQRGAGSVIIVTDAYHLPRARMCFHYLGFTTWGSPPPAGQPKTPWCRTARYWLRELLALPYYRLTLAHRFAALYQESETP